MKRQFAFSSGGVLTGAIIPGLDVGEGALIGAAGGGLYNTLINKDKRRDLRGSSSRYSPHHSAGTSSSGARYRGYRANESKAVRE